MEADGTIGGVAKGTDGGSHIGAQGKDFFQLLLGVLPLPSVKAAEYRAYVCIDHAHTVLQDGLKDKEWIGVRKNKRANGLPVSGHQRCETEKFGSSAKAVVKPDFQEKK